VARLRRGAPLAALALAGALLAGCGTSGAVASARAACRHVHHAIDLQRASERPGISAERRSALQSRAQAELLAGTPDAASATSADGSWNALMTTINEAERVPLDYLIPALTRLCRVANSSTPYL
jgi:hypothetical protein